MLTIRQTKAVFSNLNPSVRKGRVIKSSAALGCRGLTTISLPNCAKGWFFQLLYLCTLCNPANTTLNRLSVFAIIARNPRISLKSHFESRSRNLSVSSKSRTILLLSSTLRAVSIELGTKFVHWDDFLRLATFSSSLIALIYSSCWNTRFQKVWFISSGFWGSPRSLMSKYAINVPPLSWGLWYSRLTCVSNADLPSCRPPKTMQPPLGSFKSNTSDSRPTNISLATFSPFVI